MCRTAAATFIDLTLSTYSTAYADDYSLTRVFLIFVDRAGARRAVLNIFSGHLMAIMNNVSVWWHVVGAARDRADPDLRARPAPERQLRVHRAVQQLRLRRRQRRRASASGSPIIPFGFLLTQYTITGFDACAHLSEETEAASMAAAKGIWRSIFYSAIGGYILLLCVRVRGAERRRRQPRQRRASAPAVWRTSSSALGQGLGVARAVHLGIGPVLLRDVVHDVGVADDVRVQPRPRRAGLTASGRSCRRRGCPPTP